MHSARASRLGVIAALAFSGPIATAALFVCGTQNPSSSPPGTRAPVSVSRWEPFQGIDLPLAEEGPRHTGGPTVSGFDRSPAGAALAAIHATVRMSVATDDDWTLVGQRMLAPGPGRDGWAVARAQISITGPVAHGAPKMLGYKVSRFDTDAAQVDIYSVHPDTSLTRNSAQVLWQGEDWRLLLPDRPDSTPVAAVPAPPPDMVALTPR